MVSPVACAWVGAPGPGQSTRLPAPHGHHGQPPGDSDRNHNSGRASVDQRTHERETPSPPTPRIAEVVSPVAWGLGGVRPWSAIVTVCASCALWVGERTSNRAPRSTAGHRLPTCRARAREGNPFPFEPSRQGGVSRSRFAARTRGKPDEAGRGEEAFRTKILTSTYGIWLIRLVLDAD